MKQQTRNQQYTLLSAIAMVLVVMGHVNEQILTFGGLFPYYSFHIALFLFISGYFYKEEQEEHPFFYLGKKAKHLLLPYFAWNLVYGLVVLAMRACGFFIGNEPTLWTVLVEPFLSGHQFSYNAPSWFVPALFLAQAANVLIRKILRFFKIRNEWALQGLYLILGFAVVWLSANGYVYDWYRIPGRLMYMLPCFQMGKLYREKLEKKDTLPDLLYFGILIAAQLLQVCHKLNIDVPSQMKIVGFDDVNIASLTTPPITTIHQPIREMAEMAVNLLADAVEGKVVPKRSILPVALVERGTT